MGCDEAVGRAGCCFREGPGETSSEAADGTGLGWGVGAPLRSGGLPGISFQAVDLMYLLCVCVKVSVLMCTCVGVSAHRWVFYAYMLSVNLMTTIKYSLSAYDVPCHCSRCLGYVSGQNAMLALKKLTFYGDFVCAEGMGICLCVWVCCVHILKKEE